MATGSGIAAQVMLKKESTYGTRVVPTVAYEFESEGGVRNQKYLESRMLRAGRFFQSGTRRVLTTRDAGVTLSGEVTNKDFGSIVDLGHGNTVTPAQQAATTAYLQTHNWTNDPTKSATIQVGKPDTGGTVRPFDYTGSMLTGLSLSCAVDDWLKFSATFDAQDEDTAQTLATASYSTALEGFHFQQCVVTVNSVVQNLTTGSLVRSMSLDLGLPRATERYGLRSNATKAKPILNDYTPGSGSLGFEFSDLVQYGLFTVGTKVPLTIAFTGASNAGTAIPFAITFTMASVQFTGTTPAVTGPDILGFDAPFVILDDGTNAPLVVTIMETRTTAL
jgi:hypothetical protein